MNKSIFCLLAILLCQYVTLASFIHIPPEANYNFEQLASSMNYPFEQHNVTTKDGYVLSFYRIQAKNSQIRSGLPVAYIQHGLLDSADSSILNTDTQSPGLILANQGFDVWIGNTRGNKYSLDHTNPNGLNSSNPDSDFWNFSWQEMSIFDVPAAMEYIGQFTGKPVNYLGHSEGTTIMFAALARQDATVLQYLGKFIALAPAVYVQHSMSPLVKIGGWLKAGKILASYQAMIKRKTFGFMSLSNRKIWEVLCIVARPICVERIRLLSDTHPSVDNLERLPITTGHFPAGTSVQNMLYWQQMFGQDTFTMYDYGKAGNLKAYGTETPPAYDLGKITVPVYIYAGQYDELAPLPDTITLRDALTGSSNVQYKTYPLGHNSFFFGRDVATYMADVIQVLNS
jgi:pimeloyl-ACP methyl ester carboxylesterase